VRLADQATTLTELLHADTQFASGSRVLEAGCGIGAQTVILADRSPDAEFTSCLVDLQQQAGGDALIGRRLYPLLAAAGYRDVRVSPRTAYADGTKPHLADSLTRKTFTAMVERVAAQAIAQGLIDAPGWAAGVRDLRRAAESGGTFCYTFFKAVALRPEPVDP
jgi:hypothetical protein